MDSQACLTADSAYTIGIPTYRAVWSDAVRAGGASHGLIDALETSPSSIARSSHATYHRKISRRQKSPGPIKFDSTGARPQCSKHVVGASRHSTVARTLNGVSSNKILFPPVF
jgi:hypothetical protein